MVVFVLRGREGGRSINEKENNMKQEMKHVGFSAPLSMREELEERAEAKGISKSALIKCILADWLAERKG